jgi:hypothetical protein
MGMTAVERAALRGNRQVAIASPRRTVAFAGTPEGERWSAVCMADRAMQRWHTIEQLGLRQALLASGALLLRDVTIARTGEQEYNSSELLLADAGEGGMIRVMRDEAEVFHPRAMASFEGMPITMTHPDIAIDPFNWSSLAVGHAQNVRRQGNTLIADLMIHARRAIDAVRNRGWRGVSCGYHARYEALSRDRLRQTNIVGNHLALLPPDQEPRCGNVCMIGDAAPPDDRFTEPIAVRVPKAMQLVGVSRTQLYRLAGRGEIILLKCGRSTLVEYRSLRRLITSLPRASIRPAM